MKLIIFFANPDTPAYVEGCVPSLPINQLLKLYLFQPRVLYISQHGICNDSTVSLIFAENYFKVPFPSLTKTSLQLSSVKASFSYVTHLTIGVNQYIFICGYVCPSILIISLIANTHFVISVLLSSPSVLLLFQSLVPQNIITASTVLQSVVDNLSIYCVLSSDVFSFK